MSNNRKFTFQEVLDEKNHRKTSSYFMEAAVILGATFLFSQSLHAMFGGDELGDGRTPSITYSALNNDGTSEPPRHSSIDLDRAPSASVLQPENSRIGGYKEGLRSCCRNITPDRPDCWVDDTCRNNTLLGLVVLGGLGFFIYAFITSPH